MRFRIDSSPFSILSIIVGIFLLIYFWIPLFIIIFTGIIIYIIISYIIGKFNPSSTINIKVVKIHRPPTQHSEAKTEHIDYIDSTTADKDQQD